jgi:hypothetical protein
MRAHFSRQHHLPGDQPSVYARLVSALLYADAYATVTIDEGAALVRYVRSSVPYSSIDEMRHVHARIAAALPDRTKFAGGEVRALFDVREAVPRNDEAFEQAIVATLQRLLPRFSAHAFLVKSAVGRLQLRRLAKRQGDTVQTVFDNEADALRYLRVPA